MHRHQIEAFIRQTETAICEMEQRLQAAERFLGATRQHLAKLKKMAADLPDAEV